jgi:hypothetical protein
VKAVTFRPDFLPLCGGDICAALLLSQIFYWHEVPGKDGKCKMRVKRRDRDGQLYFWIAKTSRGWCEETGFTPKQHKRAWAIVKSSGLVVSRVMKLNGYGIAQNHIRLDRARWPKTLLVLDGPCKDQLDGPSGDQLYIHKTTSIDYKHKTLCGTSSTEAEKTKNNVKSFQGEEVMKAEEVISEKKVGKKIEVNVSGLAGFWMNAANLATGDFQYPLNVKQGAQLKMLGKKVGQDTKAVIAWALSDWTSFAYGAMKAAGIDNFPTKPNIGYLLKHAQHAYNGWLKATTKPKAVSLPPPTPVAPVASNAYKPPTPEEHANILAILAEATKKEYDHYL